MGCDEHRPSDDDLIAVAEFSTAFAHPDFCVGEWVQPEQRDDGVIVAGWWNGSDIVGEWETALYDHRIINPGSDYVAEDNVDLVNRVIQDPQLVAGMDLDTLRRVLTFLARAERHSGGGWYEHAFETGMAQAATRRLGELAAS